MNLPKAPTGSATVCAVSKKMDRETYDKWLAANNFRTHAVGTKDANDFGLYDMHGNVWEWCLDIHAVLPAGFEEDPSGPSTGSNRSTRGGSADSPPEFCRSSSRLGNAPSDLGASLGFRVYCELESSPETAVAPFDTAQAKAHQKAWADHLGVPVISINSIGMKFAMIPPGEFMMGSPKMEPGRNSNEMQHKVTLTQPFLIGTYEVTQSQYEKVAGSNPSRYQGANNPVDTVNWDDAVEFCRLLSVLPAERAAGREYRLPTEAEWEYACRAGATTAYSFGNDVSQLGRYAWFEGNGGATTHAVGMKTANPWGLYDMHGNSWEWCFDLDAPYTAEAVSNPQGPQSGTRRSIRSGAFFFNAFDVRSASRASGLQETRDRNCSGFRVAMFQLPFSLKASTPAETGLKSE